MRKPFRLPPVTEIVVSTPPGQILAAELRGDQVWALYWRWPDQPSPVGAVHAIRITRLTPEAKGAFAVADEAGTEAFLDLANAKIRPNEGERLLAQVTRPPEAGKRLTLRPDVRLPGRYLVYSPTRPGIAASRQMRGKDSAQQLQGLLRSHAEPDEGLIVRAAAAGLPDPAAPILAELARHRAAWAAIQAQTGLGECLAPPSLLESTLAERPGTGPLTILAQSNRTVAELQHAANRWCPAEPITIEQERGNPFITSGAQEALDEAFLPEVSLPGHGTLWIEQTRACWSIDIDTGNAAPGRAQEIRQSTNRAAAVEIARQVRLRRLAGSVVVDFLRMGDARAEQAVLADLRAAFAEDPAQLRFNERFDQISLYAFNRQRLGPDINAMYAGNGRWLSILNGLDRLCQQSLADQTRRYALAISPSAGELLPELLIALVDAKCHLGQDALVITDPHLAPNAFAVRPHQA